MKVLILTFSILMSGCGQLPDHRQWGEADLIPPSLEQIFPMDETTLKLLFNEEPKELSSIKITPELAYTAVRIEGNSILIPCSSPMIPGREYIFTATVADERGNTMTFLHPFYGYNHTPPGVILNEITTQGSSNHPDMVELKVLTDGNLAGLCFTEGTTDLFDSRLIFPEVEVSAGDLILIHCKPRGTLEERDETGSPGEELGPGTSGGLDAHPTARDFWLPGGDGLGGNNGVLALYAFPGGPVLDGFLYSNRTSSSDENYRGFGSLKVMDWADQLAEEGGWRPGGELIAPEDGVNPDDSTATRSICRDIIGTDTDSSADWHIVPTSMASFGEENSEEVYGP